jgi:alkaline phosphatase D
MKKKAPMGPGIKRRNLVKGIAAGSLLPLLGGNLLGCSSGKDPGLPASFRHGVASGDPLEDRVILWTRATPDTAGTVRVHWELATGDDFAHIVASGDGDTGPDVDYTVKVDATGLEPGTRYYYRFSVGDRVSPVGHTRTLPAGSIASASFAVVSCSNYPAGFFNVYREVANADVDAVLHLGDYIYEYPRDGYAGERAAEFGRLSEPEHELLTLSDYRTRYGQYRGDVDLQGAHAAHPFIVVWDDHELTNDTWHSGAENHDAATEGDFGARIAAALQAWYEWMPVRPPANAREIIYRQFRYGDLVDLLMLDTRLVGRDQQVNLGDFSSEDGMDLEAARAAMEDPGRSLLGDDQNHWLEQRLKESTAHWQVLGQQVLVGRYTLPAPVFAALGRRNEDENAMEQATAELRAAVEVKRAPAGERSREQQALLDSAIPFNMDAWDGYGYNREQLLRHAAAAGSRLVTLAGDTHNAWAAELRDRQGTPIGIEFATPSVSSPGLESILGLDAADAFEDALPVLIDELAYSNLKDRGYLVVSFTPEAVLASWRFVSNIDSRNYQLQDDRSRDIRIPAAKLELG